MGAWKVHLNKLRGIVGIKKAVGFWYFGILVFLVFLEFLVFLFF
jgi:hypothetical protein